TEMIPVSVVGSLPITSEWFTHRLDVCQPLHGRHAVMPWNDGAHRMPMMQRQLTTIHLVRNQHVAPERLVSWQAARVGDRLGRNRRLTRRPPIGALEHDLARVVPQPRAVEQAPPRAPPPPRLADGAKPPLCPRNLGNEKDAPIARAFQRGNPRLGWHVLELLEGQRERLLDRTVDAQLVRGEIHRRGLEMTAYVEELRRCEIRVDLVQRSLQIRGLLLSDGHAHRIELP